MRARAPLASGEREFLRGLNRKSRQESFDAAADIDWSARMSDAEYLALYQAWSLLAGTGRDAALAERARIDFARYQQINLMLFTELLERHGLRVLRRLCTEEDDPDLLEALEHFAAEEKRHQLMFARAIGKLEAEMPGAPPLPRRHVDASLRAIFALLDALPSRPSRVAAGFLLLEFAEQISIIAHTISSRAIARRESFVPRVWALHALDEARHLRFDAFIRARYRLSRLAALAVNSAAISLAVFSSFLLNANDVWAARRVGARVSLWHLPGLVRKTQAPFKRSVFAMLKKMFARPG
ncbi:MAG TPA: diiron oxygenase [Burkholderiales bacterium]|nr:diiron oxygenase [Burkholderiales bacterium]